MICRPIKYALAAGCNSAMGYQWRENSIVTRVHSNNVLVKSVGLCWRCLRHTAVHILRRMDYDIGIAFCRLESCCFRRVWGSPQYRVPVPWKPILSVLRLYGESVVRYTSEIDLLRSLEFGSAPAIWRGWCLDAEKHEEYDSNPEHDLWADFSQGECDFRWACFGPREYNLRLNFPVCLQVKVSMKTSL